MASANATDYRETSRLTDIWHAVPRLDLTLNVVNSTFMPTEETYRQSLVMWSLAPVIVLLLTLLAFTAHFCRRCCTKDKQTADSKTRRSPCLRTTAITLAAISTLVVCVGFYGNREAEKGLDGVHGAAEEGVESLANVQFQTSVVNQSFGTIRSIVLSPRRHSDIDDFLIRTARSADVFVQTLLIIDQQITADIDVSSAAQNLHTFADLAGYRWLAIVLLFTFLLVLFGTLVIGVLHSSHYTLIVFSICGTVAITFTWIFAGVHLVASMGFADFCVNSDDAIVRNWPTITQNDIFAYYVTCDAKRVPNPFREPLVGAMTSLKSARDFIKEAKSNVRNGETLEMVNVLSNEMNTMLEALAKLTALTDCSAVQRGYSNGVSSLCNRAIPGLTLVFLCTSALAVTLSILVVLSSVVWRRFTVKRKIQWQRATLTTGNPSLAADGDDIVFNTPSTGLDDTVTDYRITMGGNRSSRYHREVPLIPRHQLSPPPAYHYDEFYRQYSDVSPSIYGIRDSTAD